MITKKQLPILNKLRIKSPQTFRELKESLKTNSNSFLQKTILEFEKEKIISIEQIGNQKLYKINLTNNCINYISLISYQLYSLPLKTIENISNELNKEISFYSLIVFGSYAKNKQTKSSDLDMAIIVKNKSSSIETILESIKRKEIINIDFHIITELELKKMIKNDEENLGKEILKNNLPIINLQIFYNIIK